MARPRCRSFEHLEQGLYLGKLRLRRCLDSTPHRSRYAAIDPLTGERAEVCFLRIDRPLNQRQLAFLRAIQASGGTFGARLLGFGALEDDGALYLVHAHEAGQQLVDLDFGGQPSRREPGPRSEVVSAVGAAIQQLHAAGLGHGALDAHAVLLQTQAAGAWPPAVRFRRLGEALTDRAEVARAADRRWFGEFSVACGAEAEAVRRPGLPQRPAERSQLQGAKAAQRSSVGSRLIGRLAVLGLLMTACGILISYGLLARGLFATPPLSTGQLQIETDPPDARVFIAGERLTGKARAIARNRSYLIHVERPGFRPVSRRVGLATNEPSRALQITLAPLSPPGHAEADESEFINDLKYFPSSRSDSKRRAGRTSLAAMERSTDSNRSIGPDLPPLSR